MHKVLYNLMQRKADAYYADLWYTLNTLQGIRYCCSECQSSEKIKLAKEIFVVLSQTKMVECVSHSR